MKLVILVSLAIVASLWAGGDARSNSWGRDADGQKLLHSEHVQERDRGDAIVTRVVVFEQKSKSKKYITHVVATDNKPRSGGSAYLMRGGPGNQNVTIHVESRHGKPLDYTIEIYGKKK